jgi:hypothetical protein
MDGVTSFNGGYYSYRPTTTALTAGSTLIASWSDGMPLVATKEVGTARRVDLGFFPPSNDVDSYLWDAATDGDLLMANALAWVAQPFWLRAEPASGTVPAGGSLDIAITGGTIHLDSGDYYAQVVVVNNDPLSPEVIVPVYLHVIQSILGDNNGDRRVNGGDIIYLVNFVFKGGPEPRGLTGDVTCEGAVTLVDIITMVNWVFKSHALPSCP